MYNPIGGLALLCEVVFYSSVLVVTLVVAMAQTGADHVLYVALYTTLEKRQWENRVSKMWSLHDSFKMSLYRS